MTCRLYLVKTPWWVASCSNDSMNPLLRYAAFTLRYTPPVWCLIEARRQVLRKPKDPVSSSSSTNDALELIGLYPYNFFNPQKLQNCKRGEFIAHIKSTAASQTTAAPLVTPQLEAFSCQLHSLNKHQIEISGLPFKKMPQDRTRPVTQRKIILATSASWVKLIYSGRLQGYNRIGAIYCKGIQNTHTLPDQILASSCLWPPPMLMDVSHVQVLNLLVCQSAVRP